MRIVAVSRYLKSAWAQLVSQSKESELVDVLKSAGI
jgi:hypothetical protein